VIRNYATDNFRHAAANFFEPGFLTFRDSTDDIDMTADHRAFFDAVCAAPDAGDAFAKGRGYKLIDEKRETAVEKTFATLGGAIDDPQIVTGAQWGHILGVPGVECDFRPKGKKAWVRFRLGKARSPDVKVNEEIGVTVRAVELAPLEMVPLAPFAIIAEIPTGQGFPAFGSTA
jgi:hypothetical protein